MSRDDVEMKQRVGRERKKQLKKNLFLLLPVTTLVKMKKKRKKDAKIFFFVSSQIDFCVIFGQHLCDFFDM